MGKRVLAAFGVVAPIGGALASGLSTAPTSADAATSSPAERTGSSGEAQLRALYRQAVTEGGRLVLTGGDRSGQDDSLKNALEQRPRCPRTSRAPKAEPLLDPGCPPRPGSRRTPCREAISPTITLHPRKHA
ncbi:hypothetical protein [Streptomyces sp. NRRL B-3229]|uniref:hypothetical protein n=1 Tax=Streptomyces sp. NRRL B-3229 TaxID=1463836 RepID=UPI0004BF7C1A|nr:hypothetical protein [Streptomyces sp. NRRL B-3229]